MFIVNKHLKQCVAMIYLFIKGFIIVRAAATSLASDNSSGSNSGSTIIECLQNCYTTFTPSG